MRQKYLKFQLVYGIKFYKMIYYTVLFIYLSLGELKKKNYIQNRNLLVKSFYSFSTGQEGKKNIPIFFLKCAYGIRLFINYVTCNNCLICIVYRSNPTRLFFDKLCVQKKVIFSSSEISSPWQYDDNEASIVLWRTVLLFENVK